jgi:hypothetical protein
MVDAMRPLTMLATLGLLAASAGAAEAGVVVVMTVGGDDSGELERMLDDAVADRHELRNSADYTREAKKRGLGASDPRDIADVARGLDADVVVDAVLRRDDGEYLLRIKLRTRDGRVAKTVLVRMKAARLGPAGKREVAREVQDAIARVLRDRDADRDRDDDRDTDRDDDRDSDRDADRDRDDDRDGDRDRDDDRAADRDRDRDDDDDDADDDDRDRRRRDDDDDDRGRRRRRPAPGRARPPAGLIVETGAMALSRTLSFSSQAGFEQAPKGYKGAFVPAGRVGVELYPFAIGAPRSVAGGLGIYAVYERAFLLTTRSDQTPDVKLTTEQSHLEVGARFRYAFGARPNLPSIIVGVGYSRRAFMVDRAPLVDRPPLDLPDVDYRTIEPALTLRFPLGTERLAVALTGQGMLVQDTGAIQTVAEYGAAKVTGVAGNVTIDAAITPRVLLRLRAEVTQLGFDFLGKGEMSNNRDNDPDQDVGGALDRWLGAAANLAVSY